MVDPAPSSDKGAPKPNQEVATKPPEDTAGATFANTKQHVADRQKATETVERFANTKNNIALINDPKNGPRFTLTKKEAGLEEKPGVRAKAKPETSPPAANDEADKNLVNSGRDKSDAAAKASNDKPPPADAKPPSDNIKAALASAASVASPAPATAAASTRPLGVPPAAEPPSKVPVDSSKTFVGPNGTYYDEAWRWMDWRGTKQSWNWPAALSFGHWFAYRRLYGHAAVYLVGLGALAAASVNDVHVALVLGLLLLTSALNGLYGNILYFLVFRRAVAHVTEKGKGSYDELKVQLGKAGGVSPIAPMIMAALALLVILGALAATLYLRGGFSINIWPLENLSVLKSDLIWF